MKLQNLKKSWARLPEDKRFEIGIGIFTTVIVILFVLMLTIEKGML